MDFSQHGASPQLLLSTAALLLILVVWFAFDQALSQPWLGLQLKGNDEQAGLVIDAVDNQGPSSGRVAVGDVILGVSTPHFPTVTLNDSNLLEDFDIYPTFSDFAAAMNRHRELMLILSQSSISLMLENGRQVVVNPRPSRPINDLPTGFWVLLACGGLNFLICLGVFNYKRQQWSTKAFLLCGLSLMLGLACFTPYGTRELAFSYEWLFWLGKLNHLFMNLFSSSALVLVSVYPKRLIGGRMITTIYLTTFFLWMNELFWQVDLPFHTFYFSSPLLPYGLGFLAMMLQWKSTRDDPVERAALLWFLLAIFLSFGTGMLLLQVPATLGFTLHFPMWVPVLPVTMMFIGLTLGILRYGLFDLYYWWFYTWLWFLGGLTVIGLDLLLLRFVDITIGSISAISVLFVGLVYFPLRQLLWRKIVCTPEDPLYQYLPELVESLFLARHDKDFERYWQLLLKRIFKPLQIYEIDSELFSPTLQSDGLELCIPGLGYSNSICLAGRDSGRRLFTRTDRKLVQSLQKIAKRALEAHSAREAGIQFERDRIMRDLHDDVGAQLLAVIHSADSNKQRMHARNAMTGLRETIHVLKNEGAVQLGAILGKWRQEVAERLGLLKITLNWQQPEDLEACELTARQHINYARILRESVTNALKHAKVKSITVCISVDADYFVMSVENDGVHNQPDQWQVGVGMSNIKRRTDDIEGTVRWNPLPGGRVQMILSVSMYSSLMNLESSVDRP